MQENVIDLRPFFTTPLRWWRVVITCVVALSLVAGLLNYTPNLNPDVYRASAGIAVLKTRTQVSFNSSVETLNEEDLATQASGKQNQIVSDLEARRQTLVALVKNGIIETSVLDQLYDIIPPSDREPGVLSSRVHGEIVSDDRTDANSDLIRIVVESPDPQLAAQIANAWAVKYERLVNDVYGRPTSSMSSVQQDVEQARNAYRQAQNELVEAIRDSRLSEMQRQIEEKRIVLDTLHEAYQQAISTTVALQLQSRTALYRAALEADTANRLLAFTKEQEGKRALIGAYLDTQTQARLSAFAEQAKDRQRVLTTAYTDKARVESLLLRAHALRDAAQQGGDPNSVSLALAFFKAEVAGMIEAIKGLELRFESVSDLAPADLVADTESLVAALEAQQSTINTTIEQQTQQLLNDENLAFHDPDQATQLTAFIQKQYPKLFQLNDVSYVAANMNSQTPLSQSVLQLTQELLQLQDQSGEIPFSAEDTPLKPIVTALEKDMRELASQLEAERGKRQDLTRARDLSFEAYSTLARKMSEIQVADQLPGTEVRFAAYAVVPRKPANETERRLNLVLFAFLGMFVGLTLSFILEFSQTQPPRKVWGREDRFWNRVVRWILTPALSIEGFRTTSSASGQTQQ